MNPDAIDPTAPRTGLFRGGRIGGALLALVLFAGVGALSVVLGHRFATSVVVDLGPTDAGYVRDFREIERDGPVYFRWTSVPSSTFSLPVRFCGPGSMRLRVRRHFVDPAVLTVSIGGRVLGQRVVKARTDHPYEIIEFQVPEVICRSNVLVLLESQAENDRPIGVAIDWAELNGSKGFRPAPETMLRGSVVLALTAIAIWLAGGSLSVALGINGVMAIFIGFGLAAAPVPLERILRGGVVALVLSLGLGLSLAQLSGIFRLSARSRTSLVAITVATIASRSIFLHSQAFYPDYRVHALVQQTFNSNGLSRFLDHLFEIQYARSLGLQQVGGNWYPFPYPPGSYALAEVVLRGFGLEALDADMVTAIAAASLIPLLTAAVGLALGLGESASIAGAFFVAFQPLLVRRMALGYFPGLSGQFVDAAAMLLLLRVLRGSSFPHRKVGFLVGALLAGFLVYTQSIANFGLLVGGLLVVELVRRSPGGRAGAMRVALATTLALSAAVGVFYWRYLPVMENIASHRPQPESVVLDRLEQLRLSAVAGPATLEADDLDDPYSGSTIDPIRGLARLGSRLWRFNGSFSIAILAGGWLLWRRSDRMTQNLILAWSAVPIWISLLAAGLPAPNGFQHLKDLEFVAPLVALALGTLFKRLRDWQPFTGTALLSVWAVFAARSFAVEFAERLMPLVGF